MSPSVSGNCQDNLELLAIKTKEERQRSGSLLWEPMLSNWSDSKDAKTGTLRSKSEVLSAFTNPWLLDHLRETDSLSLSDLFLKRYPMLRSKPMSSMWKKMASSTISACSASDHTMCEPMRSVENAFSKTGKSSLKRSLDSIQKLTLKLQSGRKPCWNKSLKTLISRRRYRCSTAEIAWKKQSLWCWKNNQSATTTPFRTSHGTQGSSTSMVISLTSGTRLLVRDSDALGAKCSSEILSSGESLLTWLKKRTTLSISKTVPPQEKRPKMNHQLTLRLLRFWSQW